MDDPYATPIEPLPPAGPGRIARLGWLWGALAATAVTATGMYLVMQPAPAAAPEPAPTVTVTTTTTATATVTATRTLPPAAPPTPTPPVTWTEVDAYMDTSDAAWALKEAPESFRAMAADFINNDTDGCGRMMWVTDIHPDGFVIGSQGGITCGGGAHYIWVDSGNGWEELFGMQDLLPCEDFERAGVPQDTHSLECVSNDEVYFY